MERDAVIHLGSESLGRSAGAKSVRASLFAVDANRLKRIDRHIDYFGGGATRRAVPAEAGRRPARRPPTEARAVRLTRSPSEIHRREDVGSR